MTAINISANRDPVSGKLKGSYEAVAAGVNFIGTVGHGNTLTITDSLARFGSRVNAKPLFVSLGDSLNGSPLGRLTSNHMSSNLVISNTIKAGSLPSSLALDIKQFGTGGLIGNPIITQDQSKPLIQYLERRMDFSLDALSTQNNGYYVISPNYPNNAFFSFDIDGRIYSHTNDGSAGTASNGAAVATILIDLINADSACKCTASTDGTFPIRLVKKNLTDSFIPTYSSTITQALNNKHSRIYAYDNTSNNNAILNTKSSTSGQCYMESDPGNSIGQYYNHKYEVATFMNEELVLKNSSAVNVRDGFNYHYKNSELLNPLASYVTHNTGQSPLGRCYLNQFSNGQYGYWIDNLMMYIGYQCWDDEYNAVYLADSATITAGTTKLVRQPQSFWFNDRVVITQIESLIPLSGAHVHVRTGLSTFIYLGQLGG